jgi:Zn-dependent protease with chaperone function
MLHVVSFLLAFFVSFLVASAVPALLAALALRAWRRLPAEPWTERARRLQPIRVGHGTWVLVLPFAAVVARPWFCPEASLAALLIGAILGGTVSGWPLNRAVFPEQKFRDWIDSAILLSVVRLGWVFLVLAFALAMPAEWSRGQLVWVAGFLVAAGALSAGLIHRLLVALGRFKPAGERLSRLVAECAAEAKVTVKSVWEIPGPAGFAAALVAQRALIFSTITATEHNDEELRSICRHELAHLTEGRGLLVLRIAQTPLTLLPAIFVPTCVATMGPFAVLGPLWAWLLLQRFFAKMSLRLEHRADAAARQDAESPDYARALERLHRRNLVPAVLSAKTTRTHPDLYERMIAAGLTPDYARPAPPEARHWLPLSGQLLSAATMLAWLTGS